MLSLPDSKYHGANMGPIWGRQDPCGPHVGSTKFAICGFLFSFTEIQHTGFPSDDLIWRVNYAGSLNEIHVTNLISKTTRVVVPFDCISCIAPIGHTNDVDSKIDYQYPDCVKPGTGFPCVNPNHA